LELEAVREDEEYSVQVVLEDLSCDWSYKIFEESTEEINYLTGRRCSWLGSSGRKMGTGSGPILRQHLDLGPERQVSTNIEEIESKLDKASRAGPGHDKPWNTMMEFIERIEDVKGTVKQDLRWTKRSFNRQIFF
jgi:hypothetical protein